MVISALTNILKTYSPVLKAPLKVAIEKSIEYSQTSPIQDYQRESILRQALMELTPLPLRNSFLKLTYLVDDPAIRNDEIYQLLLQCGRFAEEFVCRKYLETENCNPVDLALKALELLKNQSKRNLEFYMSTFFIRIFFEDINCKLWFVQNKFELDQSLNQEKQINT
ncbi:MAG: hypothetical protein SFU25_05325 [Candidatus Caenarcaniphilales bacterium]|nr:hypothetical protein [Candidatus Caenarcaniphilales bacterium]